MLVFFFSSPRIGGAAFMLMLLYLFLKIQYHGLPLDHRPPCAPLEQV